jgi:N-acetyltransferase
MDAFALMMRSGGGATSTTTKKSRKRTNNNDDSKVQLCLNLGQRGLRPIECTVCGMRYAKGQPDDERSHTVYHTRYQLGPTVRTHKLDRVLWKQGESRVVEIPKELYNARKGLVKEVVELVHRDLGGFSEDDENEGMKGADLMLLYITEQRVKGCLIVDDLRLGNWDIVYAEYREEGICAEIKEKTQARIGVQKLWVIESFRKKGVAKVLMDCCLNRFSKCAKDQLSFTELTKAGLGFVRSYMGLKESDPIKYYTEK